MKLPCLLAVVASRVVVAAVIVIVVVAVAVAVAAQGLDRTTGNEQQLDKLTCCLLHICLHSLFPPTSLYQCTLSSASLCVSPPSSLSPSLTTPLSLFSNVTNCALVIFIRSCCCHCQRCPCSTLSARLLQLPRPPFFLLPAYRDACYRLHICNAELACACLKWLMTAQLGSGSA